MLQKCLKKFMYVSEIKKLEIILKNKFEIILKNIRKMQKFCENVN